MEGRKMCCTRCKGTHLSIIADGSNSTTGGSYLGKSNAFVASTQSRVKHSWICADCGNRFRMPDELLQEEKANKINAYIGLFLSILFFLPVLMIFSPVAIIGIFFILLDGASWALFAYYRNQAVKARRLYDEITANCWL